MFFVMIFNLNYKLISNVEYLDSNITNRNENNYKKELQTPCNHFVTTIIPNIHILTH